MNNKLPAQKGGSDPQNRNPFWKFVVPTVSYFAWLPEGLARAFCAESLDTSPTRSYADPVQCLADLEGYEGPRGEKFGVPAVLGGLTPLGCSELPGTIGVLPNAEGTVESGVWPGARAGGSHPSS